VNVLASIAAAALACSSGHEPTPAPTDSIVAFVLASFIPMVQERVLPDHTVVVRGDRIVAVGPAASTLVPEGATVIDGAGRFLLPGLAEMHGHIPPPQAPPHHIESVLFLYVANGITTVRGMLGFPGQLELKERAARGEIVAPNLYLAGPSFSGNSIDSPEQAASRAREQAAEGWDLLKVHPGLTRAEYDAMAETAREVGIRFGGHVPEEVGLLHAIEMGQETFDHLDGYEVYLGTIEGLPIDESKLTEAVRRTREARAWVVPTMVLWETLYGSADLATLEALPELRYAPPEQVREWIRIHRERLSDPEFDAAESRRAIDARMRILEALHDGGVRVLMGTDAPQQFSVPGFSLHREMSRMTEAGMSPYEVLVTGTRNVGEYFANEDDFGTIDVGKRADLLLLRANPLDSTANVAELDGVMVRGQWLPRAELDARLEAVAEAYAAEGR
jgi:imidazolonepropionase-like amidohydrolase